MREYWAIAVLAVMFLLTIFQVVEAQETRFGVTFGYHDEDAITKAHLVVPLVQEAGIQSIKFYIHWSDVEPNEGDYRWNYIDIQLNKALEYGIEAYVTFGAIVDAPDWVDTNDRLAYAQKKANFLGVVADRYQGKIKYYAIEGEPGNNYIYTWETYELYKQVVGMLANSIRSNDSNAMIVGLGSDVGSVEGPKILYQALHDQEFCNLIDIIEYHLYPKPDPDGHPPTGYPAGYPNSAAVLYGKLRDVAIKNMMGEHCRRTDHDQLLSYTKSSEEKTGEYQYSCTNNDCISSGTSCCSEPFHCSKPIWLDYGVRSNLTDWCDPATPQCLRYPYVCDFDDVYMDQDEEYQLALSSMFGGYEGILDGYNSVERLYIFRVNDATENCGKFGLITYDNQNIKPSYWAVKSFIEEVRTTRSALIDSTAPLYVELVEGTGSAYTSGAVNGGPDDQQDNAWTAINDYLGFAGVNAIVAHPTTENAYFAGIHISGLQNGATYSVNVRFVTTPGQPEPMGARVSVPDQIGWKELHQGVAEYSLIREYDGGSILLQEREVYVGDAIVDDGEVVLFVNDEGGSIIFEHANITGISLKSYLAVPRQMIFSDGFESGDISAWSLP